MTNKIGEKIKNLRKKSNVTQEKLADYLGITFQAVSRWESGISYPDLEILPAIANYFSVTTDELLGVDIMNKQEKIKEIDKQLREKESRGLIEDGIAILRTAVNEFPNEYGLLSRLALYLSQKDETKQESISIDERILKDCADDNIRYEVIYRLAQNYDSIGEKAKAIEMGNKLPYAPTTRDMLFSKIGTDEEKIHWLIISMNLLSDNLVRFIMNFAWLKYKWKDAEETHKQIELYKKAINIIEIMYEEKDYGLKNDRLYTLYLLMAGVYLFLHDFDNAFDCIEKSADYAMAFDDLSEITHKSIIFEGIKYSKTENYLNNTPHSKSYFMLNEQLSHEQYNPIRETERFKAVVAKLEEYASKET